MPKQKLSSFISALFEGLVLILAFTTPFLFWSLTSEFYETPKFLLLALSTGVLIILWVLRLVVEGRVSLNRTPLDVSFLLLLITFVISTLFAGSTTVAILGQFPKIHGSLSAFVVYTLYYFVLVSNLRSIGSVKRVFWLLIAIGTVLSVLSLLSYFGISYLPPFSAVNFTPTGAPFSTTAILALITPFIILAILRGSKDQIESGGNHLLEVTPHGDKLATSLSQSGVRLVLALLVTIFSLTVVLTGVVATQLALAAGVVLSIILTEKKLLKTNLIYLLLPLIITTLIGVLSFAKVQPGNNVLLKNSQNFPREIQLPLDITWKVSISAFRDSPFFGSGPGTYLSDFSFYKPLNFNSSRFWNYRFDSAFNEYLQILATLGGLGLLAFLFLTIKSITLALRSISTNKTSLATALSISTILFFIILALHASTLTIWIVGILILASLITVNKDFSKQYIVGFAASDLSTGGMHFKFNILPLILGVVVVGLVAAAFYQGSKFTLADIHHRQAIVAVASKNPVEAYNQLVRAERLNPYVDLYRTDIAQTNFALANAIAASRGPTESSPSGSLTEADKANIKQFLSQSINESRAAAALNPNNPTNWEVLGSIYRQMSGVATGANTYAIDAYGRAIQRDPLNPNLRLTVGGIYFSLKNYDLAIRLFNDAVNLKPDFANGYYNLAIALRAKGNLTEARLAAEKVMTIVGPQSKDYQIVSTFLSELKNQSSQVAGASTSADELKAEGQPNAPLNKDGLPQVLELPEKDNVATPEAIKKNP